MDGERDGWIGREMAVSTACSLRTLIERGRWVDGREYCAASSLGTGIEMDGWRDGWVERWMGREMDG